MKKLLFFIIALISFFGCSKEDEQTNDNYEIQGSAWSKDNSTFKDHTLGLGINGRGNYSYSTTTAKPEFRTYDVIYVYKKPTIEIKFEDGSNFGSGIVDGNKMDLGFKGTFTRYR